MVTMTNWKVKRRRTSQYMQWANMNQFMRHRNQIDFFVRFETNRSLKCLQ